MFVDEDTSAQSIGETTVASTIETRANFCGSLFLAVSALILGILCGMGCG